MIFTNFLKYFQILFYIVLWWILGIGTILFNKWILYYHSFSFPLFLVLCHMTIGFLLSFIICKIFKITIVPKEDQDLDWNFIMNRLLPIGICFAIGIGCTNMAYLYISVSFIQMLKALTPCFVLVILLVKKLELFSFHLFLSIFLISFGIGLASYGNMEVYNLIGIGLQLSSIISESFRLYFLQINLQGTDVKLNPVTMLYFLAPICFCTLLVPFFIFEYHNLLLYIQKKSLINIKETIFYLILNALVAFFLNISMFLLISHTSSLTINATGVIKDCILIVLSSYLFHTIISLQSYIGYIISIFGLILYIYLKYEKQKQSTPLSLPKINEKDIEENINTLSFVKPKNSIPFFFANDCIFCIHNHKNKNNPIRINNNFSKEENSFD